MSEKKGNPPMSSELDSGYGDSMSSSGMMSSESSHSDSHRQVPYPVARKSQNSLSSTTSTSASTTSSEHDSGFNSSFHPSSTSSSENEKTRFPSEPKPQNSGTHEPDMEFPSFLNFCAFLVNFKPNWTEWTPNTDIRQKLTPELLQEGRDMLWEKHDDQDNDFEALNAARLGDENAVALAVLVAPNHKVLNTMNDERQTLLHVTAEHCSAKLSRLLITRGADGAIPDVYGDTPLHIAAANGRADVITALTLPLTKQEVKHPYYKCPYKSLPQDNVNSYNHDGRVPVHLAAAVPESLKHREAVAALSMYAKCNMDYRRLGDGYAASHIAIDNGDEECLQVCLDAKADSEVRNYKGETPQQLAFLCRSERMVHMCQKYGAGAYQLEHAVSEPVVPDSDDEEMDCDEDNARAMNGRLSHQMQGLTVG